MDQCYSTQKSSPTTQERGDRLYMSTLRFLPSEVIWKEKCKNTNNIWPRKIETSANLGINRIYFVLISPPKISLYLLIVGDEVMAQEIVF